jgi:leader peptidase (prepilin peptidase) / N-methyltransferase
MIPLLIFILGICIGSFLNVLVFRTKEAIAVTGRSKCRKCEISIKAYDLIPVLSFFILRGRCRGCKASVSGQYPAVELVTGLLFLLSYLVHTSGGAMILDWNLALLLLRDWVFVSLMIIIFVYDFKYMLILDRFTLPGMIMAILLNLWIGIIPSYSILAGGVVLSLFFYLQFVVSKGTWVGGGDIRLGALMGFMLGIKFGLLALFIAYILGSIIGIALLITKKVDRKTQIAFGTFLSLSTVIVMFTGPQILNWYLGFFS